MINTPLGQYINERYPRNKYGAPIISGNLPAEARELGPVMEGDVFTPEGAHTGQSRGPGQPGGSAYTPEQYIDDELSALRQWGQQQEAEMMRRTGHDTNAFAQGIRGLQASYDQQKGELLRKRSMLESARRVAASQGLPDNEVEEAAWRAALPGDIEAQLFNRSQQDPSKTLGTLDIEKQRVQKQLEMWVPIEGVQQERRDPSWWKWSPENKYRKYMKLHPGTAWYNLLPTEDILPAEKGPDAYQWFDPDKPWKDDKGMTHYGAMVPMSSLPEQKKKQLWEERQWLKQRLELIDKTQKAINIGPNVGNTMSVAGAKRMSSPLSASVASTLTGRAPKPMLPWQKYRQRTEGPGGEQGGNVPTAEQLRATITDQGAYELGVKLGYWE